MNFIFSLIFLGKKNFAFFCLQDLTRFRLKLARREPSIRWMCRTVLRRAERPTPREKWVRRSLPRPPLKSPGEIGTSERPMRSGIFALTKGRVISVGKLIMWYAVFLCVRLQSINQSIREHCKTVQFNPSINAPCTGPAQLNTFKNISTELPVAVLFNRHPISSKILFY